MTDYARDKAYERSEWWRVPALPIAVVVLIFVAPALIARIAA